MYNKYIKRLFDIVFSLLLLIILFPFLLIIGLLVRVFLGKPVLFRQQRPGLNEKIFTIYKFRTMNDKKDEAGNLLADFDRLTLFGRFLRDTSLDELPELVNILKGEMSFVGPRPLLVDYLQYYNEEQRLRHTVRPGLTGLAQVNGRNVTTWQERFVYDILYVKQSSFLLDCKIVLKTIYITILRKDINLSDSMTMSYFNGNN